MRVTVLLVTWNYVEKPELALLQALNRVQMEQLFIFTFLFFMRTFAGWGNTWEQELLKLPEAPKPHHPVPPLCPVPRVPRALLLPHVPLLRMEDGPLIQRLPWISFTSSSEPVSLVPTGWRACVALSRKEGEGTPLGRSEWGESPDAPTTPDPKVVPSACKEPWTWSPEATLCGTGQGLASPRPFLFFFPSRKYFI